MSGSGGSGLEASGPGEEGGEGEKSRASLMSSPREESLQDRRPKNPNLLLSAEAAQVLTETLGDTIRLRPPDPLKYIADALWRRSGYTPEEYSRELEESRRLSQANQRKSMSEAEEEQ